MSRPGLDRHKVLAAAAELVDQEGPTGLTVSRLAARLRVRPPSLYNHMVSLEQLEHDLAVRGLKEVATRLRAAATGVAEGAALTAAAHAYRAFAKEHPGLYVLSQRARHDSAPYAEAAGEVIAVVGAVLSGYGLHGEQMLHATRALRSALHGFVSLEVTGGFGMPLDLDESFARLIQTLHEALRGSP